MCVRSAKTSVDGGTGKVVGLVIASKTELDDTRRRVWDTKVPQPQNY